MIEFFFPIIITSWYLCETHGCLAVGNYLGSSFIAGILILILVSLHGFNYAKFMDLTIDIRMDKNYTDNSFFFVVVKSALLIITHETFCGIF